MRICPECKRKTAAPLCERDGFETVPQSLVPETKTSQDLIGQVIENRFLVEAWIGGHRSCAVYRATQLQVGRQVALRIIEPRLTADLRWVAAFQRQARVLGSFTHPHLAQVFDFGPLEDGSLYVASELVRGKALHETLNEQKRLSPKRTTTLGLQVLEGLVEAHTHGIVHFDLTPENIMLVDEGGRRERVKIVGFGILKGLSEETNPATWAGRSQHSARYMDPELSRGRGATGRADLYALACILFEALTGKLPFDGKCAADYLVAHATARPSAPIVNGEELHGPLIDFIYRCLEKDPRDRFQSTGDAIVALQACAAAPLLPGPPTRAASGSRQGAIPNQRPPLDTSDGAEPQQSTMIGVARPVVPSSAATESGTTQRGAPKVDLGVQSLLEQADNRDDLLRIRGLSDARPKIVRVPTSRRTRRPARSEASEPPPPPSERRERLVPKITQQQHLSATIVSPVVDFEDEADWPRRRGGWLWAAAALVLCACGAFALWQFLSPGPAATNAVNAPSADLLVIDEATTSARTQTAKATTSATNVLPTTTAPAPVPALAPVAAATPAPVPAPAPVAQPVVVAPVPAPIVQPTPAAPVAAATPSAEGLAPAVAALGETDAKAKAVAKAAKTNKAASRSAYEGSTYLDDRATDLVTQRQRDIAATNRIAAEGSSSTKSWRSKRTKKASSGGRLVNGVWQEGPSPGAVKDDAWDPARDARASRERSSRFVREVRTASSAKTITIESSPPGATVYLGAERIGRTPLRVMHGDPHGKRVKLTMAGYESKSVRMPGNGRLDVKLVPR